MNITGYLADGDDDKLFTGTFSLVKEYRIENAEESIYQYLGINTSRPITALIHPDDVSSFEEAVHALHTQTQHIIVRLMSIHGNYRYMYFIMSLNGRIVDDFESIDVIMQDIVGIHKKFEKMYDRVFKYRELMAVSSNLYMDYTPQNDLLRFYEYSINRSVVLFDEKLSDFTNRVRDNAGLTETQKKEYSVFAEKLQSMMGLGEIDIDGKIFGFCSCYLKINMSTFNSQLEGAMVVAVVSREHFQDDEKYYLSDYAIDSATSVYNKRAITELANEMITHATRACYVVIMDVDDFKLINDTYGHMTGDLVMAKIAGIIKSVTANRGYVGRFGGDEFLMVLDRVKDDDEVILLLKTIRKNMNWECQEIVPGISVTASIGIARYPEHGMDYQRLFNAADKCLYIAKQKGKNRYIIYKPEVHGGIEQSEGSTRDDLGIKQDNLKCYKDVFDLIMICSKFGIERIKECMDNIRNSFGIDGIRIFDLMTGECMFVAGNYPNGKADGYMDYMPEIMNRFNSNGLFVSNKILTIMETCPKTYARLDEQGVAGVLMLKGNHYLVEFDVFGRLRKWSDADKGMMMMLGKALDVTVAKSVFENMYQ